jgi:hypothetical protein
MKDKKHLARTLMSKEEIRKHVSPFLSKNWTLRVESIQKRIQDHIDKIKKSRLEK